jgi:hypothetical protein
MQFADQGVETLRYRCFLDYPLDIVLTPGNPIFIFRFGKT